MFSADFRFISVPFALTPRTDSFWTLIGAETSHCFSFCNVIGFWAQRVVSTSNEMCGLDTHVLPALSTPLSTPIFIQKPARFTLWYEMKVTTSMIATWVWLESSSDILLFSIVLHITKGDHFLTKMNFFSDDLLFRSEHDHVFWNPKVSLDTWNAGLTAL